MKLDKQTKHDSDINIIASRFYILILRDLPMSIITQ